MPPPPEHVFYPYDPRWRFDGPLQMADNVSREDAFALPMLEELMRAPGRGWGWEATNKYNSDLFYHGHRPDVKTYIYMYGLLQT